MEVRRMPDAPHPSALFDIACRIILVTFDENKKCYKLKKKIKNPLFLLLVHFTCQI
jgi:hypothetical protein